MARGLNRVTLIGYVERELQMRYTPSGQAVTWFAISTTRPWHLCLDERRRVTDRLDLVAWGDLAEAANRHLQPHQRVYAEGHLQTRQWIDETGGRYVCTEIVVGNLIPLADPGTTLATSWDDDREGYLPCLNRVMIIGNLGRDPELHYASGGHAVTYFNLAATCRWTTADSQRRVATEWVNVISWGRLAEICNQYLRRGRRVYVEGGLCTRRWRGADGCKHVHTEVLANEMILLGPRSTGGSQREVDSHLCAERVTSYHVPAQMVGDETLGETRGELDRQ